MGHEKTLTGLTAALAGANLIYGPGMLESGITFDFAQLVMDNEFARMIRHTVQGFEVNAENLATEVIAAVGPAGHLLSHAHTLKHMRSHSQPHLIDRRKLEKWQAAGATDIYTRAAAEARRILQEHVPQALPSAAAAEIREIIEETEGELGVKNWKT
jgi:trimethylamine--corrinoid protein Co-methyltransferase